MNGQKKKALEIYDDILRIEPDNRNALMALLAYEKDEGDPDKADALTEKVLLSKNITSQDRILLMRQEIGQSEQEVTPQGFSISSEKCWTSLRWMLT